MNNLSFHELHLIPYFKCIERTAAYLILIFLLYFVLQKAWCARKRYRDFDQVTREKTLAYVSELLASETVINEENPHLSVIPIRVNASDDYEGDLPSYSTVMFHIKGVRDLYIQQCINEEKVADPVGTIRTPEIQALLESFKKA